MLLKCTKINSVSTDRDSTIPISPSSSTLSSSPAAATAPTAEVSSSFSLSSSPSSSSAASTAMSTLVTTAEASTGRELSTGARSTSAMSTITSRIHRKAVRIPSKRHPGKAFPGKLHSVTRIGPGKMVPGKRFPVRLHTPHCDNSNDSGFGFDQHVEIHLQQHQQPHQPHHPTTDGKTNGHLTHGLSNNCPAIVQQHQHQHSSNNTLLPASAMASVTALHQQQHQQQQQSLQHFSRSFPAPRTQSTTKNLQFLLNNDDHTKSNSGDERYCNDDSDDLYGSNQSCMRSTLISASASSSSSSSSSSISPSTSSSSPPNSIVMSAHTHLSHIHDDHVKRKRIDIIPIELMDNDDACSEDAFIRKIANAATNPTLDTNGNNAMPITQAQVAIATIPTKYISGGSRGLIRVAHKRQLSTPPNSVATSSDGRVQLEIISQPEQQHRARYQTEGSRGAVKDRSGNGFPIVRLIGYNKPAVLQVFIGTDIGRVAPHMFYQACKVAGKNSTQCSEKKVDGTAIIEIDFKPDQDMIITCDCVGILKERNVDVEHRFPDHLSQKNKKKSTRCRMVFRTQLTLNDGAVEMLQVCSNPIVCTQPPGIPEISKKSLNSCPVEGGLELFIIGKNFFKDTHVIFQDIYDSNSPDELQNSNDPTGLQQQLSPTSRWKQIVFPDKEYLQQTHLICTVPPYAQQNILKPVTVQLAIISSGKSSEFHSFVYTPKDTYTVLSAATSKAPNVCIHSTLNSAVTGASYIDPNSTIAAVTSPAVNSLWSSPSEAKLEIDADMMPPPITTQIPMGVRRPSLSSSSNAQSSTNLMTDQQLIHLNAVAAVEALKTEKLMDDTTQNSLAEAMQSTETAVACNLPVGNPHSPSALPYHSGYGHKSNIDAMVYEANGFPVSNTPSAVVAAVKMAVKNEIGIEPSFLVNNTNAIDQALSGILQQATTTNPTNAAVSLERSLSSSSASSSTVSNSSPLSGTSPVNSLANHNSPITQDIILNSEPAVALNAALPIPPLLPSVSTSVNVNNDITTAAAAGISTEIIMNPSVSPSTILCSDNGAATAVVPNIMTPHQVTMANSILNDIAMEPQPTQQHATVAALAISNIILTPPADTNSVTPTPNAMQSEVASATSTAVSNMIIKAAAELISNQEQQQQAQQQTAHQIATSATQLLANPDVAADSLNPLNLLLTNANVVSTSQNTVNGGSVVTEVTSQFPLTMNTSPPESLIVALATENALQKSVTATAITSNGVVTQETSSANSSLHSSAAAAVEAVAAVAAVPLPQAIPQEITTMSDQDLISYINPSTFDQVY